MLFCGSLKLSAGKGSQIKDKKNLKFKCPRGILQSIPSKLSIVKWGWNEMLINQRFVFIVRTSIYFLDTAMLTNRVIIVHKVYEIF